MSARTNRCIYVNLSQKDKPYKQKMADRAGPRYCIAANGVVSFLYSDPVPRKKKQLKMDAQTGSGNGRRRGRPTQTTTVNYVARRLTSHVTRPGQCNQATFSKSQTMHASIRQHHRQRSIRQIRCNFNVSLVHLLFFRQAQIDSPSDKQLLIYDFSF